jgi:hypothetical protein
MRRLAIKVHYLYRIRRHARPDETQQNSNNESLSQSVYPSKKGYSHRLQAAPRTAEFS